MRYVAKTLIRDIATKTCCGNVDEPAFTLVDLTALEPDADERLEGCDADGKTDWISKKIIPI